MFGTSRRTHEKVRDGSGDSRGGLGLVGGPSERSETGRGTLGEVRGTLEEVRNGSGDYRGGPGRVGGPSGR